MLYDVKHINEIDYQIYNKWFENFIEDISTTGIIYLQSTPKISYQRVLKRERKGETMTLSYITACHHYHEKWLNNKKGSSSTTPPILQLDCSAENTNENVLLWQEQLTQFITLLVNQSV